MSANFTTRAILINKIIYLINYGAFQQMVRPRGFEPLTHWLKASCSTCWAKGAMVPFIGLEPTTYWLQVSCSANWAKTAWWKLRDSNPWIHGWKPCVLTASPIGRMAPTTRIELVTHWLTASCSTAELCRQFKISNILIQKNKI